jgi:hypothetical protein
MRKSSILVAFEAPMHNDVMYIIDAVNDILIYSGRSVRIGVFLAKITVGQAVSPPAAGRPPAAVSICAAQNVFFDG